MEDEFCDLRPDDRRDSDLASGPVLDEKGLRFHSVGSTGHAAPLRTKSAVETETVVEDVEEMEKGAVLHGALQRRASLPSPARKMSQVLGQGPVDLQSVRVFTMRGAVDNPPVRTRERKRSRVAVEELTELSFQMESLAKQPEILDQDFKKAVLESVSTMTKALISLYALVESKQEKKNREVVPKAAGAPQVVQKSATNSAKATGVTTQKVSTQLGQGNGPAATSARPTYREVAARKVIGHWRTEVVLQPASLAMEDTMVVEDAAENLIKRLTTQPYVPQKHEVVALRFERVASRKKVSAKEWRNVLKEKEITPHGILYPQLTTIELVVPKEQELRTKIFFASLGRQATDPDPYKRRDGQVGPLEAETLQKIVQQRIEMLEYERSIVTLRHLESTVVQGLAKLPETRRCAAQLLFDKAKAAKGLVERKPGDKLTVSMLVSN